jgi:phage gp46-like protein
MPDIRLVPVFTPDVVSLDWLQTPTGDIDQTAALTSAVLVALCSDAEAGPNDVLPNPTSTDRRGWWGDLDAETIWNGWPIGSKLWLLTRDKIVGPGAAEGATVTRVQNFIAACLAPFVTAGIASSYSISVAQQGLDEITAAVIIYRGPKTAIQLQFQALWTELINGAA